MTINTVCRICRSSQLVKVIDLGKQPLANAFVHLDDPVDQEAKFPLEAYLCDVCNLLQLIHVVDKSVLFSDYIYFSSGMPKLSDHFRKYAEDVMERFLHSSEDLVVEIGSNDGILLQHVKEKGYRVLGVDPAQNIAPIAEARGVPTITDFFSERVAHNIVATAGKAQVLMGNNVVAHINDYQDLGRAVRALLSPTGVFVFEAPYLVDMFERLTFDTIYHEHLNFLAIRPLLRLFEQFDMEIFDVKIVPSQGQSIRVFVGHRGMHPVTKAVHECILKEIDLGLNKIEAYKSLAETIAVCKEKTVHVLSDLKARGKKIMAYGAPAKGNTVLNYYAIGTNILDAALDELPSKQGLCTPGMHVPVVSREYILQNEPDVYLLLAWNYASVIFEKEHDFLEKGGVFVLPTGDVLSLENNISGSSGAPQQRLTKKFLIAGGAGFIGSNFIRHIYNSYPEYQIFNLDLLTYCGNQDNLADIEKAELKNSDGSRRYIFVQGDICNKELVDRLIGQEHFDVVVNFAAESHVDRSLSSAYDFIRTNVVGVHTLLEVCRKHKVPRYVQISTDEVYGDIAEGFVDESAPLNPSNPYAASKASADVLIRSYMRSHNFPAVIIRGSNNVGPYQYPEKLIPLAISNFLENKKMPIHGDGFHVRSWLYVEDFCRAIDRVVHDGKLHEVYNASGTPKSNLEVLAAIHSYLKLPEPLDSYKIHTKDRPGADRRYSPAAHKINTDLGWSPVYDFDKAIKSTVDWYMAHEDWWRDLKRQQGFLDHYKRQQEANYY